MEQIDIKKEMNTPQGIVADQRNGNLHITLKGRFSPDIAALLTTVMAKSYQGKGNIFIHTSKLTRIAPNSKYAFSYLLGISGLSKDNVYFLGENGLAISHDACKVIVHKKKHGSGGCGKCKNCSCHAEKVA